MMTDLPGARFNRELGKWLAPLSWATCITLRGIFESRLTVGPNLGKWAWQVRNTRISPAMKLRDKLELDESFPELDAVEQNCGSKLRLFQYQRVDVRFLTLNERALLANEPGLGKTASLIRTLQVLHAQGRNPFPALIACPNSLKFTVWQDEVAMWAPELTVQVVDGGAAKRRKQLETPADIYVMNWESLRLHSKLAPYGQVELTEVEATPKELNALGHRTVIFDEAHRMKDARAKQTRAAWAVAHQAKFRYLATGTPTGDNIGDLWALLHGIEKTWFPAKTRFIDRYAQTTLNFFGGSAVVGINPVHKEELFQLIDPLMRRVPKEAALPQLPEKMPVQIRHTPMTAKQKKAYDQMQQTMLARLDDMLLAAPNALSQLTRLLQFAAAYAEIDDAGNVKLTNPSAKIDDMVDLLEEMGDKPLVVAAVSRQLIELASKRLTDLKISHGLITGSQSSFERKQAVDDFQAGRLRVIMLTLGAGAEGITLTRADTMLFMQEDFSEIKNSQARDRIYRIGSEGHQSIRIIKQVTPDSVEERKLLLLEEKQCRMEEIVRDRESLMRLLGA